jgi:spore maturation protein CgeB
VKILVVCMRHNYGDPRRELSFEYFNFYQVLVQMGHDVELFDFAFEVKELGKGAMNQKLLNLTKQWKPDVTLFSLYTDEFEPIVVNEMRRHTKTICFFHDDTWRINFSRFWAKQFDFFTTPDVYGELKYREIGLSNAIYFPFGCNERISKQLSIPKKYDVSFVGGWHPHREWIINRIRNAGFAVEVFGHGWPNGEVDQEGMVKIFNESHINLNLSNSSSWDVRYLLSSFRAIRSNLRSKKKTEQLKARIFEVGGCNAFQLTYYVEGMASCFQIDEEIAVYADPDDLIQKIKFYLNHLPLRESIAAAGYKRVLECHTFAQRFKMVLQRMGFENE